MKVSTQLAAGTGLVFLLLTAVLAYEVGQVDRLARLGRDMARSGLLAGELSIEQIADLGDLEATARKSFVTLDPDYAVKTWDLARRIGQRRDEMAGLGLSGDVQAQWARFDALWRPVLHASHDLPSDAAGQEVFLEGLKRVQTQAFAVAAATRASVRAEVARAGEAARRARTVSYAAALAALLVGAAALVLTVRSIHRPLARLARGAQWVAEGRFDQRVEVGGGDEFARLSADFNRMVDRLGELDQMKKDLLSHVSHELKAPLAAIQETNQLLLEGLPGPVTGDQRRLLDLNLQSVRRLSGLIAKLLDLARMEAGVLDYDLGPCDLGPLLRAACTEMQILARDKGVEVAADLPPEPLWVTGDGDRLHQVAANLLENAIKFSPHGSAVAVSALLAADLPAHAPALVRGHLSWDPGTRCAVLVTVADRGPGVPDDQKERIFDRFHQVRRGRAQGSGVGLGLAICREIAAAHGGAIWVTDNAGGGSVFTLALAPCEAPRAPALKGDRS